MWWLALTAVGGAAGVGLATGYARRRRDARAIGRRVRDLWPQADPLPAPTALQAATADGRDSAEAWYCLGLAHLTRACPEHAARAFQIAAHRQYDYTSAALLGFACMRVAGDQMDHLADVLRQTHREMRCPALGATWRERALLEALGATMPLAGDPVDLLGAIPAVRQSAILR